MGISDALTKYEDLYLNASKEAAMKFRAEFFNILSKEEKNSAGELFREKNIEIYKQIQKREKKEKAAARKAEKEEKEKLQSERIKDLDKKLSEINENVFRKDLNTNDYYIQINPDLHKKIMKIYGDIKKSTDFFDSEEAIINVMKKDGKAQKVRIVNCKDKEKRFYNFINLGQEIRTCL
jgi:hypothetical protein